MSANKREWQQTWLTVREITLPCVCHCARNNQKKRHFLNWAIQLWAQRRHILSDEKHMRKYLHFKMSSLLVWLTARRLTPRPSPGLRVLLTDSCVLASLSSKHGWQAWLGKLLKTLSSRRAIKPERSSQHRGSAAVFQRIFISAKCVFSPGLSDPARITDGGCLKKIWLAFWTWLKITSWLHRQGFTASCRGHFHYRTLEGSGFT